MNIIVLQIFPTPSPSIIPLLHYSTATLVYIWLLEHVKLISGSRPLQLVLLLLEYSSQQGNFFIIQVSNHLVPFHSGLP